MSDSVNWNDFVYIGKSFGNVPDTYSSKTVPVSIKLCDGTVVSDVFDCSTQKFLKSSSLFDSIYVYPTKKPISWSFLETTGKTH